MGSIFYVGEFYFGFYRNFDESWILGWKILRLSLIRLNLGESFLSCSCKDVPLLRFLQGCSWVYKIPPPPPLPPEEYGRKSSSAGKNYEEKGKENIQDKKFRMGKGEMCCKGPCSFLFPLDHHVPPDIVNMSGSKGSSYRPHYQRFMDYKTWLKSDVQVWYFLHKILVTSDLFCCTCLHYIALPLSQFLIQQGI